MAFVKCPDCSQPVYEGMKCPHCDRRPEQRASTQPDYEPWGEESLDAVDLKEPAVPRLGTCAVCGGKCSTAAATCPHCGQPFARVGDSVRAEVAKSDGCLNAIGVVIACVIGWFLLGPLGVVIGGLAAVAFVLATRKQ